MALQKTAPENLKNYLHCIPETEHGAVYPLSVAEGFQQGEIFENTDKNSVFIRHDCGFGFLFGHCDRDFLENVSALSDKYHEENKRLILFTDNPKIKDYFAVKSDIVIEQRYYYKYCNVHSETPPPLPDGYVLREMDGAVLSKLQGRITPAFSWRSDEEFLEKGKGFCVLHGENIAAWAFSSAISSKEIDIGVETRREYQHRGLAAAAASGMIDYILQQKKKTVWACHAKNTASQALAMKIGFRKHAESYTIRKEKL